MFSAIVESKNAITSKKHGVDRIDIFVIPAPGTTSLLNSNDCMLQIRNQFVYQLFIGKYPGCHFQRMASIQLIKCIRKQWHSKHPL